MNIDDDDSTTFQNAGYMGLYGGETVADIHARKKLKPKEKMLSFMNSSELIANLFRISQTEERTRKENIRGANAVSDIHHEVGEIVRDAITDSRGACQKISLPPQVA